MDNNDSSSIGKRELRQTRVRVIVYRQTRVSPTPHPPQILDLGMHAAEIVGLRMHAPEILVLRMPPYITRAPCVLFRHVSFVRTIS